MCLAIPGKIESFVENSDPKMGTVNFGGIRKTVCMEMLPEANVNDYVIVHVGFAISIIDEEEAKETLRMLSEAGELKRDLGE
ncbi:MAG: HypC/HybG/HupF family hydrogenase formation chaperone [Ignavibacteriales bacterium]|nr:HypC/HybG/HupF family hydrogenase formation chaperone [Ignavibacteriales bacterium]